MPMHVRMVNFGIPMKPLVKFVAPILKRERKKAGRQSTSFAGRGNFFRGSFVSMMASGVRSSGRLVRFFR
jgi:hypothetical protein